MASAASYLDSPTPSFLFDLDGTLIDSVYQHVIAWRTALMRIGIELSVWRIHRRIGMSGGLFVTALLRETGRSLSKQDIDALQQAHAEEYRAQMDSVTALSPGLHRTGVFAPTTWADDNAHDLDLGSTQPALLPGGMLLEDGKRGTAYLVDSAHLGGVGGQVAQADVCEAYGGAAVQGSIVYEPCAQGGLAAVDTTGNEIRVRWRGPASAQGSPVIGGGAVWVTDYQGGTLYELDQATGATRGSLSLGTTLPHFSSMSMTGSHAFLGTMEGVIAVGGV